MGYIIHSALSISPNDKHKYFIYFLNGHGLQKDWIEEWFKNNFSKIANELGRENGVLIMSHPNSGDNFFKDIKKAIGMNPRSGIFSGYEEVVHLFYPKEKWKEKNRRDNSWWREYEIICDETPTLIFTRTPLKRNGKNEGIIIKLNTFQNESFLAELIDTLMRIAKTDDISILKELIRKQKTGDSFIDYLELKPNFMGIGVNFNKFFGSIGKFYSNKK
ncbi:hypothetical protein ACFLTI_08550 [Bacteroidota bacterium]